MHLEMNDLKVIDAILGHFRLYDELLVKLQSFSFQGWNSLDESGRSMAMIWRSQNKRSKMDDPELSTKFDRRTLVPKKSY